MTVIYPITFTITGKGWRNRPINVDLNYQSGKSLTTSTIDKSMLTEPFTILPNPVNGYFLNPQNEKVRITNFVGYDGQSFLKQCPQCGRIMRLEGFDYSGRYTGEERDQSNCMDCRAQY